MPARNLAREYQRTLDVQHNNLGRQFLDEEQASKLYQSLSLENQNYLLNGSPEMDFPTYKYVPATYYPKKKSGGGFLDSLLDPITGTTGGPLSPLSLFGGGGGGGAKLKTAAHYDMTGTQHRGAQRGLLSLYENDIIPSQIRQATAQRAGDIADVQNLSPAMRTALRTADPDSAKLLDLENQQAGDELGMGAGLDPSLMRLVSQSIRGRQNGSLLSNGNAGAYDEALKTGQFGMDLRDRRRGFASNVVGQNQAFYGNPFERVLNRSNPNAALATSGAASSLGNSSVPRYTNPESPYAGDLYNTNFNAAVAAAINAKNNQTALIGAGISAVGNIAGGAAGLI